MGPIALVERLQLVVETVGTGAAARDINRAGDAIKGLGSQAKAGRLSLAGLAESAGISSTALKAGLVSGAIAAGGALVKFGADSVSAFTGLAAEIRSVQRAMGGTAEEASMLVAAGDDMNVSTETIAKAMFQLAKRIELSRASFTEFGVTVAANKDGSIDMANTVVSLADAYNRTNDPARRAALLTAAFGRAGQEMIPILERGGEGLRQFFSEAEGAGQIFSQDDLDKAEELRLAQDALSDAMGELKLEVGRGLTPVMTDLALAVTAVVEALNAVPEAGRGVWDAIADGLGPVGDILEKIGVGNPMPWLRDIGVDGSSAADGLGDFNGVAPDTVVTLEDLSRATLSTVSADRALEQSQRKLTELMRDGAVDEEKVATARQRLADATRSAASADRALAKAQREYDEALAAAEALGQSDTALEKLTDASDRLTDAKDSSASAHERENEAAKELRVAQAGDPDFQQKLADAKYDVARNAYESAKAHEAEEQALAGAAGEVANLRGELTTLLALNPQMQPFVDTLLKLLQLDAAGGGDFGMSLSPLAAGTGAPFAPLAPLAQLSGTPVPNPTGTSVNQITINAPQQADPVHIARRMMWELN